MKLGTGVNASLERPRRIPANLIQAQRDYLGAHTCERTEKPGSFHTKWNQQYAF